MEQEQEPMDALQERTQAVLTLLNALPVLEEMTLSLPLELRQMPVLPVPVGEAMDASVQQTAVAQEPGKNGRGSPYAQVRAQQRQSELLLRI